MKVKEIRESGDKMNENVEKPHTFFLSLLSILLFFTTTVADCVTQ